MINGVKSQVPFIRDLTNRDLTEKDGKAKTTAGSPVYDTIKISYSRIEMDRLGAYRSLNGCGLDHEIDGLYEDYYAGTKSVDDIRDKFRSVVDTIRKFDVSQGYFAEGDEEHYKKIVEDVACNFKRCSISAAFAMNWKEEKALAEQYGTADKHRTLYYNSDYYFKAEEDKQAILEEIDDMGVSVDLEDCEVYSLYKDFNTYWSNHYEVQHHIGHLIDTDIKPPKGLVLFYNEERYSDSQKDIMFAQNESNRYRIFDGVFKISFDNWKIEDSINLKYGPREMHEKSFLQLAANFLNDKEDEELKSFLANIFIHRI